MYEKYTLLQLTWAPGRTSINLNMKIEGKTTALASWGPFLPSIFLSTTAGIEELHFTGLL